MYLTFEVISANAASLGAGRRKVFTVDGGRIGRSPENDMVLPGVGVHRHHATVRFINGVFFVEDEEGIPLYNCVHAVGGISFDAAPCPFFALIDDQLTDLGPCSGGEEF